MKPMMPRINENEDKMKPRIKFVISMGFILLTDISNGSAFHIMKSIPKFCHFITKFLPLLFVKKSFTNVLFFTKLTWHPKATKAN